jgi:O-antigen/teichoic acid export membrane protein
LAAGSFVGLWTLRNHVRATLFARRATPVLSFSDLGYSAGGAAFVAALVWIEAGEPQVTSVFWALAAANVIGIAIALKIVHTRVRVSFRASVRARYRRIWVDIAWSLFGVTMWNIQGQAQTFLVAAIAGPAAYAPIAAGMVLFNPLRLALGSIFNVIRPEFAAGLADPRHGRVRLTFYGSMVVTALACSAYGACVWLGWSVLEGHFYGGKFAHASMPVIVVFGWIAATIAVTYHVPLALVQAAHDFRAVAIATTIGGIVGLGGVIVLLVYSTVVWSLAGVIAGEAICLICLWIAALRVLRKEATGRLPVTAVESQTSIAARLGSASSAGLDRA